MIERGIVLLLVLFLSAQTRSWFEVEGSVILPDDLSPYPNPQPKPRSQNGPGNDHPNVVRDSKQLDLELTDIDVDGPYGYVPRVVHGVRKIVKGLLNGSMHSIFHGAFSIAPDDVSEDLIGTYNTIFGIVDPEDLPEKVQNRKPKSTTKAPSSKRKANSTTTEKTGGITEKKAKDEEEDDLDLDEDDDDDILI